MRCPALVNQFEKVKVSPMTDSSIDRPSVIAAIRDAVVLLDIETAFDAAGFSVLAYYPGETTDASLSRLNNCRGAVIDPDIGWSNVQPLMEMLRNKRIPALVFSYGEAENEMPDWVSNFPRVDKPFNTQSVVEMIARRNGSRVELFS